MQGSRALLGLHAGALDVTSLVIDDTTHSVIVTPGAVADSARWRTAVLVLKRAVHTGRALTTVRMCLRISATSALETGVARHAEGGLAAEGSQRRTIPRHDAFDFGGDLAPVGLGFIWIRVAGGRPQ